MNDLFQQATGENYFTKKTTEPQAFQAVETKNSLTNPQQKKRQPVKKKLLQQKRDLRCQAVISLIHSMRPLLDSESLLGDWDSEIRIRYLLCLRDPKYRLVTILQEREQYYEEVSETITRRIIRFVKHHEAKTPSAISPPLPSITDFIAYHLAKEPGLLIDLPKVVEKAIQKLRSKLNLEINVCSTQLIRNEIKQCETLLHNEESLSKTIAHYSDWKNRSIL